MKTILAPVGAGPKAQNRYDDVVTIQQMLNDISSGDGGASPKLKLDGKCGAKTKEAIQKFQLRHFGWKLADGRVDPGGPTWIRMNERLGGPSSWAKNTMFRIRRGRPDSSPAVAHVVDVFEVQDQQHYRRAVYMLTSFPDSPLPPVANPMMSQKGDWAQLRSSQPVAFHDLQGPASMGTVISQTGAAKIYTTTLTVTKPTALITGLMPFTVQGIKQGYFRFWYAYD
jgi:hypothetical protein